MGRMQRPGTNGSGHPQLRKRVDTHKYPTLHWMHPPAYPQPTGRFGLAGGWPETSGRSPEASGFPRAEYIRRHFGRSHERGLIDVLKSGLRSVTVRATVRAYVLSSLPYVLTSDLHIMLPPPTSAADFAVDFLLARSTRAAAIAAATESRSAGGEPAPFGDCFGSEGSDGFGSEGFGTPSFGDSGGLGVGIGDGASSTKKHMRQRRRRR